MKNDIFSGNMKIIKSYLIKRISDNFFIKSYEKNIQNMYYSFR